MARFIWGYFWKTPPPQPPSPTLTTKPWREPSNWNQKLEEDLLKEIKPQHTNQQQPKESLKKHNLLILGPVAAGKSSFINSILSIQKNRKSSAAVTGSSSKSLTFQLAGYSLGKILPEYCIFDCMGFESDEGKGLNIDDLEFLVQGHIKIGYNFNPVTHIKTTCNEFRQNPNIEDRMHCVILIVSAETISAGFKQQYVDKITGFQEKLRQQDISCVLILTKVDDLCDEVAKDITKMFWSVKVRDAVKRASELFGIEQASIHPVKNYVDDFNISTNMNIPLLLAFRQAMNYAEDKVQYFLKQEENN